MFCFGLNIETGVLFGQPSKIIQVQLDKNSKATKALTQKVIFLANCRAIFLMMQGLKANQVLGAVQESIQENAGKSIK